MRRLLVGLAVFGFVALVPGVASAHIHVEGGDAVQGGEGTITFQVPNEKDDAETTKVDVKLPTDTPIADIAPQAIPGWKVEVKTKKLSKPIKTDEGEVTEAPSEIIWSGGKIAPGQFQEFVVAAGPFPDTASISFPTIQTYSDGTEVSWIEETPKGGPEPEHPAPVLELAKASSGDEAASTDAGSSGSSGSGATVTAASKDDVDSANTKATIGIVIGAIGLVAGLAGLGVALRKRNT